MSQGLISAASLNLRGRCKSRCSYGEFVSPAVVCPIPGNLFCCKWPVSQGLVHSVGKKCQCKLTCGNSEYASSARACSNPDFVFCCKKRDKESKQLTNATAQKCVGRCK
ncbi:Hypothetical predicted protein, partial [Podarcis lilfordi]